MPTHNPEVLHTVGYQFKHSIVHGPPQSIRECSEVSRPILLEQIRIHISLSVVLSEVSEVVTKPSRPLDTVDFAAADGTDAVETDGGVRIIQ